MVGRTCVAVRWRSRPEREHPRYQRSGRRWGLFIGLVITLSIVFFFVGLETWQVWMFIIIIYYVFWATRMR